MINLNSSSKILDIGTSTGQTSLEFGRLLNCEVIGIDITDVNDNASVHSGYSSHSQNSARAKKSLGGLTKLLNKARITSPGKNAIPSRTSRKSLPTSNVDIIDLSKDDHKPKQPPVKPAEIVPMEVHCDLADDIEMKNKIINNAKDLAVCPYTGDYETIYIKLSQFCGNHLLTLTQVGQNKFICKKDSDNSISIEINEENNLIKMYHLNGQESITKEIIKKIIINIGFD